jgi:hypothetical protein
MICSIILFKHSAWLSTHVMYKIGVKSKILNAGMPLYFLSLCDCCFCFSVAKQYKLAAPWTGKNKYDLHRFPLHRSDMSDTCW